MKVGVLYSGGKDSNFSLHLAKREHTISCLLTVYPSSPESMLFHYPNIWLTRLQSESLGIPQLSETVPEGGDEMSALLKLTERAASDFGAKGIVTGGVKSGYQKGRFGDLFGKLGLESINPLWGVDEGDYLRRLPKEGFEAIVTSVSALGLGREWLGRRLDESGVEELIRLSERFRFNPTLEGGEGETLVLDMPEFEKRLSVDQSEVVWRGDGGFLKIKSASLKEKN